MTAKQRAQVFIKMLYAVNAGQLPEIVLGQRECNTLFEMGDGREVVIEFLKAYQASPDLQRITAQFVPRYIDLAQWQKYVTPDLFGGET